VQEEIKYYLEAGKIASKALELARNKVHEDMPILELCNLIENFILSNGGQLAFPCNISINEIAAHDTAEPYDKRIIPKNAIVKVDVGVHIEGYIADAATTIALDDKMQKLVDATKKALMNAIQNIKPGITTNKIGKIVENTAKLYGFQTIKNLSGHMIKRYLLHAGKSIPNYDDGIEIVMKAGEVYAIEPFLTLGKGYVYDSDNIRIFSLKKSIKHKDKTIEEFFNKIWKQRYNLPFSLRWYPEYDLKKIKDVIMDKVEKGEIIGYNVLVEENRGIVAQEEHTVIITENEVIVTTI
jgi:methionyl aminopeptidase